MALGLIGGALAKGLGEGGQKYIDMEEARRKEGAAEVSAYNRMEHAASIQEQGKDKDQARKKERLLEFKAAAESWREKNPEAPVTQFVEHFASTEYADMLEPAIKAAQFKDSSAANEALASLRAQQTEESKARTEYTQGAKTEAERARAEKAKAEAEGRIGGKRTKAEGLSEKEYENARGDVLKRHVIPGPDGEPDPLANAALADSLNKFYKATGSMAQAERYAVDATQAGVEFAQEMATKAGGKFSKAQYSAWLDQGAQKYVMALAERLKPKTAARPGASGGGAFGGVGADASWGAPNERKGLLQTPQGAN